LTNLKANSPLKKKYPDIKISLAIGGWNYGVGSFSHLVNNNTDVEVFAANDAQHAFPKKPATGSLVFK
jgi:GH18 family chitinase